jgi:apolipoprotein N-acyltransferase
LVGHTQYLNLPIIQMAAFTGIYGVSFIIMMANAAFADVIVYCISASFPKISSQGEWHFARHPFYIGFFAIAVVLTVWGQGWHALRQGPSGNSLSVALVQGNIPQHIKWDRQYREHIMSRYERLTEEAAKSKPQLIVWPEASTPGFVLNDLSLLQRVVSVTSRSNASLLIGSAEYPKLSGFPAKTKLDRGNVALFFSPEGKVVGQYLKMRLVPFGEYIPYENTIPWPNFIVQKGKRSFNTAGKDTPLFRISGNSFGTLICWEALFPGITRNLVEKGGNFVVNITNEAWFGRTAFPYQMLSSCVFRAVENRVNVVRCANTGVSCFIDPYGRITGRVQNGGRDIFVAGTLNREIHFSSSGTFYTHYGDICALGCVALSMGLAMAAIFGQPLRNQKRDRWTFGRFLAHLLGNRANNTQSMPFLSLFSTHTVRKGGSIT